jgi:hypothetical protein
MLDNTTYWELGIACIVCIGYIWGKVWIYYKVEHNEDETNPK